MRFYTASCPSPIIGFKAGIFLFSPVLAIEPRDLNILGKHSTTESQWLVVNLIEDFHLICLASVPHCTCWYYMYGSTSYLTTHPSWSSTIFNSDQWRCHMFVQVRNTIVEQRAKPGLPGVPPSERSSICKPSAISSDTSHLTSPSQGPSVLSTSTANEAMPCIVLNSHDSQQWLWLAST